MEIKGYRELSQDEVRMINNLKTWGETFGLFIDAMRKNPTLDQRWVSIGATDLQTGLMALTRAVAQPTTF